MEMIQPLRNDVICNICVLIHTLLYCNREYPATKEHLDLHGRENQLTRLTLRPRGDDLIVQLHTPVHI